MYLPAESNLAKAKLRAYLDRYKVSEQPAAFEFLAAIAFHRIFHLPLQLENIEDESVKHYVIWNGRFDKINRRFCPSPSGPDSICYAYGFYVLIENTLRGNVANQWRKEFVESITHYDNFVTTRAVERRDVFLALIAPEFHKNTYTGFKQKAIEGYNILMLDSSTLAEISSICESITTLRHLDLLHLVRSMVKKFKESGSLASFRKDLNRCIADWELDLLRQEKTVYFGLKAYEAMKKIGRNVVGISDIMLKLERDSAFERYLSILGGGILADYIKEGLIRERLARIVETPVEDIFCVVNGTDFRARGLRLIESVESINK